MPGPAECHCVNSEHVRKWPVVTDTIFEPTFARSNDAPSRNDNSEQGPSKVKTETPENGGCSSSSTENNIENKPFPNVEMNSDKPGPSTFPSHQSAKESGNTSPKPFYTSYKEPSHESENGESSGASKKPQRKNKSSDVAECCKYGSVCLASITKKMIHQIRLKCTNLRDLRLEYCNLNCNSVIAHISILYSNVNPRFLSSNIFVVSDIAFTQDSESLISERLQTNFGAIPKTLFVQNS